MDHNFNAEPSAAMKFNEVILRQFERPCQIFDVMVITTMNSRIDLIESNDGKHRILTDGVTVGPTDIVKNINVETRFFTSRKNFQVTIVDEIMSNKVALLIFKLDENGFIEIEGDEGKCSVRMTVIPRKPLRPMEYAPDYTSTHAGIFNVFAGKSFVSGIEFLPDKKGLIISYQKPSNMIYGNGKSKPDSVWQEKHEIIDGVLVHTETRYGSHHHKKWCMSTQRGNKNGIK